MQLSLLPLEERKAAELIKHTAAIHIKTNLSLVDRKVLNILLKNAYDELGKVKYHTIRLAEIKSLIGWNSKNYEDLKKSLRKLVHTKIEWNIFGQDKKNQWFISSLLASASIAGGKCTYDYPFQLQELLKNPNIYGKINLISQNNFRSKYSLILWEYLMSYISNSKNESIGTQWIKINDYRGLMGVDEKSYSAFKEFSYNLVRSPIKEINKVSEIEVEPQYQKTGDKFTSVRFIIKKKSVIEAIEHDDESAKDKLLNFCKMSPASIDGILKNHSPEQITANIAYVEAMEKKGAIKSIAAYSFNAIKNDLRLPKEEIKETFTPATPKATIQINNQSPKWQELLLILKEYFGKSVFEKWIIHLNFIKLDEGNLQLVTTGANGKFNRDWITREHQETILHYLQDQGVSSIKITYLENGQ
jgi:hypothetical protein